MANECDGGMAIVAIQGVIKKIFITDKCFRKAMILEECQSNFPIKPFLKYPNQN